jgi:hypothetical protein
MFINNLDKNRLSSSSSPLSNDIKIDPLNNKSQSIMSSLSPQHQSNRHYCNHPDCNKVNINFSKLFFVYIFSDFFVVGVCKQKCISQT